MSPSLLLLLLSLTLTPSLLAAAEIDRHVVTCGPQQGACMCREDADECEFTLHVEELQSFIAYELEGNGDPSFTTIDGADNALIRLEEGRPFYINSTGSIVPSFVKADSDGDSDCITYNEDFEGAKCTIPFTLDGRSYRPVIAVNGRVPGPTLVVYEKQIVVVNVINGMLTETISIHWHGLNQFNTPWMDGAIHVTQCPIAPSESFRYYFKADPSGTFWYHSHRVTQRADGLFGALIVRESAERRLNLASALGVETLIDDPGTYTLNLHEWDRQSNLNRYTLSKGEIEFFPDKPLGDIPLPPGEQGNVTYEEFEETFGPDGLSVGDVPFFSGLINGKGRNEEVPYERSRLEVVTVEEGGVYRLRLIGTQNQYAYKFSIDQHNLTVIGTDASLIEPVESQFVILHTGERYDVVIKADRPRVGVDDYWMRAETLEVDRTAGLPYPSLGHLAEGILHYSSGSVPRSTEYEAIKRASVPFDASTCGAMGGCVAVNCPFPAFHASYNIPRCINVHELRLLWPTPSEELPDSDPTCDDCELFLNIGSDTDSINGRNMQLPPSPLQTQRADILDEDFCDVSTSCDSDDGSTCECVHVRKIPLYNRTVRFVLSSVGNEVLEGEGFSHPMHLHGHQFHVVDVGYGSYYDANATLRERSQDIDCVDDLCSTPTWRGAPPVFSISENTLRKDTVIVPGGGYVVIQFRTNNPGYWFLHCHIITDLLEGMAVVINEVESRHNPAPPGYPTCGVYDVGQDQFYESLAFDADNSSCTHWLSAGTFTIALALAFLNNYGIVNRQS